MESDLKNIRISEKMDRKLKNMIDLKLLKNEQDGYRLAISLAIFHNLDFEDRKLENRQNKYDAAGVDPDLKFKHAVREIYVHHKNKEYRAIEKLADAGLEILSKHVENNDALNLEELLNNDS